MQGPDIGIIESTISHVEKRTMYSFFIYSIHSLFIAVYIVSVKGDIQCDTSGLTDT